MQRSYTGSINEFEPGGAFSGGALIYYMSNFINPLRNIVLFKVEFGYTYDIVYTCGISGYSIDKQLGFMGVV